MLHLRPGIVRRFIYPYGYRFLIKETTQSSRVLSSSLFSPLSGLTCPVTYLSAPPTVFFPCSGLQQHPQLLFRFIPRLKPIRNSRSRCTDIESDAETVNETIQRYQRIRSLPRYILLPCWLHTSVTYKMQNRSRKRPLRCACLNQWLTSI